MRYPLAFLVLIGLTATACIPNPGRYPEPGEPGPVITAADDTIPEGPDRRAFLAGYRAGFERGEAEAGPNLGAKVAGAGAGLVTGFFLPTAVWAPLGGLFAAGGAAMIALSTRVGPALTSPQVPASVVDQGALYEAGFRDGYLRGLRSERVRATRNGAVPGILLGILTILAMVGT